MDTISICCIMKDEELNIASFIESIITFADEIILVDNKSSDNSVTIAKKYGVRVLYTEEPFDLARNEYFNNASCDWILTLDTDERILAQDYFALKEKICGIEPYYLCGLVAMNNYFGEGLWSTWFLPRLIRNTKFMAVRGSIHGSYIEKVDSVGGHLFWTGITLHHLDGLISKNHYLKRKRNLQLIMNNLQTNQPDNNLLVNLSAEYFALGDRQSALDTIRKASTVLVDNASKCFRYYGSIAYYCGLYQESIDAINEQKRRYLQSIANKETRGPRSFLELNSCDVILIKNYIMLGKRETALELCLESIKKYPDLSHNYINTAILDKEHSCGYIEKAKEVNPFLKEENVYKTKQAYNLYELSSSVIDSTWRNKLFVGE